MTPIVYLNGGYLPAAEARVSVLDRGFLFGDGVYEVIPAYGGVPFRLPQHLARLQDSLNGIRLANPHAPGEWAELLAELVRRNGGGDQALYLQVTRGVARRDHAFPRDTPPTVFAMSGPLPPPGMAAGVSAITARDIRWDLCNVKAITLLPNALLRQQALEAGAVEAILTRGNLVTEGAASNVFVVLGEEVATTPKGSQILPGLTRDLVAELLAQAGTPCAERPVSVEELRGAHEIWLTSSTREVVPVVRLDGVPVGAGTPGPAWQRIRALFDEHKRRWAGTRP
jgi:D-alanine transaminase